MAPETAPSGKPVSREPTGRLVPLSGSGSGLLSMVGLPRSEFFWRRGADPTNRSLVAMGLSSRKRSLVGMGLGSTGRRAVRSA
jgi:hypothetical protein